MTGDKVNSDALDGDARGGRKGEGWRIMVKNQQ